MLKSAPLLIAASLSHPAWGMTAVLTCTGDFGDATERVEIALKDDGQAFSTAFLPDGTSLEREIPANDFTLQRYPMAPIADYTRVIARSSEGNWVLEFGCGAVWPLQCVAP